MKKIFKKVSAIAIAATMTAALATSVGAAEPLMNDTWSVVRANVQGAPSSTGSEDNCHMVYSALGINVYCNSVSNTVNGGTGDVVITCLTKNVYMTSVCLYNTGESVTCLPSPSAAIREVNLNFRAEASYGNTYRASGSAITIDK